MLSLLFSPRGRINRLKYIALTLPSVVLGAALEQASRVAGIDAPMFLIVGVLSYVALCAAIKRFHDLDKSGYLVLLGLIPLVNLYLLILLFDRGTLGPNRFGSDPLEGLPADELSTDVDE